MRERESERERGYTDRHELDFTAMSLDDKVVKEIFPPPGADSSPPSSLTLRIPKDHLQGLSSSMTGKTGQSGSSRIQQPRSKLTRSKAWLQDYLTSSDPLKMFLASVYEHTDSTGVCVAEVFHELPSAKVCQFLLFHRLNRFSILVLQDYPEYYEVITEPIDLNIIKKNLEVIVAMAMMHHLL